MMTKPPGFASSSTLPLDDDEEESIDESLDEILLEAHERPLESSKSLEAVPSALELAEADDDDVIDDMPARSAASMALPGSPRGQLGEITVIAPRPTFFDEVREEETKVDPYETAIRAAASRDDGLSGLTSQASQQRDRALRKASLTPPRLSAARPALKEQDQERDAAEFEDADASDDAAHSSAHGDDHGGLTPADIPISDDDESAPTGSYNLNPSPSGGFQPRLPPPLRTSPPPGRPDIYPGRRIPTPSSDFLPVPSGGFGSGAHYPSIAIPAPSLLDASGRATAMRADNRLRLPAVGLIGFLVTAFGGGLLVGALLWRGHAAPPAREQVVVSRVVPRIVPNLPPQSVQPIVVKPVPAPSAGMAPAVAVNPPPSMPTLAAETPPSDAPPASKKAAAPSHPRKAAGALAEDDASLSDAPPPPPKPTKSKKKAVVWQDPFAQ